jgi:hypothetical protein
MNDFSDDFMDDINDDYDGGDDFTDETPEEEHADEGPIEREIEGGEFIECDGLGWEEIAFLGAMSEQIADDERERLRIERDMKKEEDEENI